MTHKSDQMIESVDASQKQIENPPLIETNHQNTEGKGLSSSIDFVEIIRLLLSKKKFIIIATTFITITAIIISLLLPETFRSTSVIIPESDKTKLANLGGLADLASIAGVGTGEISPIKLYPTILKSETLLRTIIYKRYKAKDFRDSVNLIQFWKIDAKTPELEYEKTLFFLRNNLEINIDAKTNIITLALETGDAQLSADVINSITSELDEYMRTKRTTNATKQRLWIESRLAEVKQDLTFSEDRLKTFREKNRSVAGSPLLLLEQDRLIRDIQINGTLYTELKKQYELIKIEEIKNIPIVNVLDLAIPAASKDKPKRGMIVLTSFFIALIGSAGYVYVKRFYFSSIAIFISKLTV